MTELFADLSATSRAVMALTAAAHAVGAAQLVANRREFGPRGLLAWRCVRCRYAAGGVRRAATREASGPILVAAVASLEIACALAVIVAAIFELPPYLPLAGVVVCSAALAFRAPYGRTAADGLADVMSLALLMGGLGGSVFTELAALVFVTAVLSLAYCWTGLVKLGRRGWYDGTFLQMVFSTASHGHPLVARLMARHAGLACVAGGALVAFESLFPLLLVLPATWAMVGLAMALLFHMVAAVTMGLNTFLWTFPAGYPAILLVNHLVHGRVISP